MNNSTFSSAQLDIIERNMREAIEMAKLNECEQQKEICQVGCIIYNCKDDSIVAKAADKRHHHNSPLSHAVMCAIDSVANCQRVKERCISANTENNESVMRFLCSGYDCYVTREPCCMCSMALLHSRISRVFYGCPMASGALGSKFKLHTEKKLNHHFEVFSHILVDECSKLYCRNENCLTQS